MAKSRRSPKRAVALGYDAQTDAAPRVLAKGERRVAERIIELAKEHGIPIQENPDLVALLAKVDVSAYIPEELYLAVAEVLAFVYRLNNKLAAIPRPSK